MCLDATDLPDCLTSQGSNDDVGTINCDDGYWYDSSVFLETTVTEVNDNEACISRLKISCFYFRNRDTSTSFTIIIFNYLYILV